MSFHYSVLLVCSLDFRQIKRERQVGVIKDKQPWTLGVSFIASTSVKFIAYF